MLPYKILKEEYKARSDLLRILSTQAMAEHVIHQHKMFKFPQGAPENLRKTFQEARRNDYEMMRLVAKQHSHTLGMALFRFGEARRACSKAVFATAAVVKN